MTSLPAFKADDPAAVDSFIENGVVCLRGAISPAWIERLKEAADAADRNPGPHHFRFGEPGQPGAFFGDVLVWQREPAFESFAHEGPLADIAGRLMKSETVTFYHDFLLIKSGGSTKRTPWHQDQSYWCLKANQALTIWSPLDPISAANTLEFVRGSHRWAPVYAAVAFDKNSSFDGSRDGRPEIPDIDSKRDAYEIVSWELQPGDCLIFHCRTLHAAPGNPHAHARRVLSTCWAGDDARYIEIKSDLAPPVKGDGLVPGDRLACKTFPQVRPRAA